MKRHLLILRAEPDSYENLTFVDGNAIVKNNVVNHAPLLLAKVLSSGVDHYQSLTCTVSAMDHWKKYCISKTSTFSQVDLNSVSVTECKNCHKPYQRLLKHLEYSNICKESYMSEEIDYIKQSREAERKSRFYMKHKDEEKYKEGARQANIQAGLYL